MVEKPGKKLIDYLKGFDKTKKGEKCFEDDCLVCKGDTNGNCRKPDIVYKITCQECAKKKVTACYYGESNFNAYTRGKQHLEKYRSSNKETQEKLAMRKHAKEIHDDKQVDYESPENLQRRYSRQTSV